MSKRIELLAPAGDLDRVKVAVRYGADAVYCGGKELSLRTRAGNLTIEEIREAVRYAGKYGAKIYVTVNMVPRDEDVHEVRRYLEDLEDAGVSAIIVSSRYIAKLCKKAAPEMEVHISTQQSVTNSTGVKYWQSFGADRVVLARECTEEEISLIASHTGTDLEVFIHGGMCSGYSGRCVLSNYMSDRDANRGGCAQSCRWKYHDDQGHVISFGSKDLDASGHIPFFIDQGIASLKIEGRMKTAFYLASVVRSYRYLIDTYYKTGTLSDEDYRKAKYIMGNVQNRETYDGFLRGIPGKEGLIEPGARDTVAQDYIADIVSYDGESKTALIRMRNHLEEGEWAEVLGRDNRITPFEIRGMRDEEGTRKTVSNRPMELLRIEMPYECESGDYLRRVKL